MAHSANLLVDPLAGASFCYGTIKAVIFDLDGTLVDSAPDIQVAIN